MKMVAGFLHKTLETRTPRLRVRRGASVVEMLTTTAIVAVLACVCGTLFARLLSIRERDREEAYVRERLSDICAAYADAMSIGSYIVASNGATTVKYRCETGGVSLETGLVSRVSHAVASMNPTNRASVLDIYSFNEGSLGLGVSRTAAGDAELIPLGAEMTGCTITPLNGNVVEDGGTVASDAVLGYLRISARYKVGDRYGDSTYKTVSAGRLVRLWNRE